jgi:hypothetical protein
MLAKHGYKVVYGAFQFVCNAAGYAPAEHDTAYTHATIASCLKAAAANDAEAAALRSGESVPSMFQRWNPTKVKINRRRGGQGTFETKGDYDVLPIAQATPAERTSRINSAIAECESNASGFRGHVAFLRRDVLTRYGQPLYVNEELTKTALSVGLTFKHNGVEHVITRPAFSRWGHERLVGWYVLRVGADPKNDLRWTSKQIRDAMNPKPAVVAGAYATKQARKDDLDKLNRAYDKQRNILHNVYLNDANRTEARTELYYAASQLSHWRPKHAEGWLREFPATAPVVETINTLFAERERVKAAL